MALFRKRQRTVPVRRGPLVTCVEDLPGLPGRLEALLAAAPGDALADERGYMLELLAFPVRSAREDSLRGAVFYALFHGATGRIGSSLADLERAARALTLESADGLAAAAEGCRHKPPADWSALERVRFVAMQMAEMRLRVDAPQDDAPPSALVQRYLATMAEYCQSDSGQKNARESFLMAHVPWYDYERLQAENAFGALCLLANDRVNGLVEQGGVELHCVVRQGPEEHPAFHPVAAACVFFEYVRCQTGTAYSVFFAKDFFHATRKEGDLLLDADRMYIYRNGGRLTGPFLSIFEALDAWITYAPPLEMPAE